VRTGIDSIACAYYTVADGHGETTAARDATIDVGGDHRPAAERCASVLYAAESVLDQHDFDGYVEGLCQRFYADEGRPGLPSGRYFRLLLIGYFEGVASTKPASARRCIVRRDTGESYQDFLTKLAQASGIETPTRADLARIDRKRKKKGSNDDWTHPHDPDAKIAKMKDARTHLAHKAEHAVGTS
jgi:hypothetical protein